METFLEPPTKEKPKVYFNEEEFRDEHGVSRSSFWKLHNVIQGHNAFTSVIKRRKQRPVSHQLLMELGITTLPAFDSTCYLGGKFIEAQQDFKVWSWFRTLQHKRDITLDMTKSIAAWIVATAS